MSTRSRSAALAAVSGALAAVLAGTAVVAGPGTARWFLLGGALVLLATAGALVGATWGRPHRDG